MLSTIKAVVNNGRIELLENIEMPDGTQVLVTVLPNDDDSWLNASERSLSAVWNNSEDDVYAELLER
ncbi:MAG TPA: hypothetical protein VN643_08230 [Pyrinomonadaceae bacterium]|nr:hypothetical protein [Pyrinomonadaceae bacterium]